jgi:hypothetical protein
MTSDATSDSGCDMTIQAVLTCRWVRVSRSHPRRSQCRGKRTGTGFRSIYK